MKTLPIIEGFSATKLNARAIAQRQGLCPGGKLGFPGCLHSFLNPVVGFPKSFGKWARGLPAELFRDQAIVRVASANAERAGNVLDGELFPRDLHDHLCEVIDRDHLFGTDVDRSGEIRLHEAANALDALVDIQE